jgi:hypothetical protein
MLSPRQIHLDFHTSPELEGIGENFSKEHFQAMLQKGNVSSITVFAKCHHSLCYYPTEAGIRHPGLSFDLLGEMMDAAHEIGVRAPVYITAGWSSLDAENHPEWLVKNIKGNYIPSQFDFSAAPSAVMPQNIWLYLCLNDGAYARHIYDITREICNRYKRIDGLFIDICIIGGFCYCDECKEGMVKQGLNPENESHAEKYYYDKHQDFMQNIRNIAAENHPEATVFFNSGGANIYLPRFHGLSTHFEIEDLPTVWGGYDKMPMHAKYFSCLHTAPAVP